MWGKDTCALKRENKQQFCRDKHKSIDTIYKSFSFIKPIIGILINS